MKSFFLFFTATFLSFGSMSQSNQMRIEKTSLKESAEIEKTKVKAAEEKSEQEKVRSAMTEWKEVRNGIRSVSYTKRSTETAYSLYPEKNEFTLEFTCWNDKSKYPDIYFSDQSSTGMYELLDIPLEVLFEQDDGFVTRTFQFTTTGRVFGGLNGCLECDRRESEEFLSILSRSKNVKIFGTTFDLTGYKEIKCLDPYTWGGGKFGIKVVAHLDVKNRPDGVIVDSVYERGKKYGFQPGDVITSINSQWITSVKDFSQVVQELYSGKLIPVRVIRNAKPIFIALKID